MIVNAARMSACATCLASAYTVTDKRRAIMAIMATALLSAFARCQG